MHRRAKIVPENLQTWVNEGPIKYLRVFLSGMQTPWKVFIPFISR